MLIPVPRSPHSEHSPSPASIGGVGPDAGLCLVHDVGCLPRSDEGARSNPSSWRAAGHRPPFLGVQFDRAGQILQWVEGQGYSFSDLSTRSIQQGFPRVYRYHVRTLDNDSCCIQVCVRGRWTAGWMPRWMVQGWLRLVMMQIASRIRLAMHNHRLSLHQRGLV